MANIQDKMIDLYLQKMMGGQTPVQRERQQLALESQKLSITPLQNFENNFSNKWNRASSTGGLEDISVLDELKLSNENLYNSMTKNMNPDKKIPITDAYNSNIALIAKQKKKVADYEKYKETINFNFGELETALFHNAATLDSLGGIYAEGFDNWEDIYVNGTDEQVAKFTKDIQPHLVENGDNISKIMQKIVKSEKDLAEYGQFSDIKYVARDIGLLRDITSNLSKELKSTTFLTDKEAKGLQDMWINKDIGAYSAIKTKQQNEAKIIMEDLKSTKRALVKREADFTSRLRVMSESDSTVDVELQLSKEDISTERLNLKKAIEEIDFKMLRTGEFGSSIGVGGDIALSPISDAAIKAVKAASKVAPPVVPPQVPPQVKKTKTKTITGIITSPKVFDVDSIVSTHADVFTGVGFSRTKGGDEFKKKHGLTDAIMSKLKEIEVLKNSGAPPDYIEENITKKKKDISDLFSVESSRKLGKVKSKAIDYMKAYSKGNKIPANKIGIIKEAYPNIDKYIKEWREYGSGNFTVWLHKRIKKGKADIIDYNKFKGIL